MEVWLEARPTRLSEVKELCDIAEDSGITGLALNEVKCPPDLAAAVVFNNTERVKLVTSLLIAFPRSPMITAYNAWQLQAFSKGRFELGLGTQVKGHMERRYGVEWAAPQPRMREYVRSLRAIWDTWQNDAPLDVRGEHYQLSLMTPDFNPGPIDAPFPLIHTGGVNAAMCRLGGQVSDGLIMAEPITKKWTDEVMLPAIEEGLVLSERSRDDFIITGGGYVGVGETDEEVKEIRELIRYRIAFYSSTRTYKGPLEMEGFEHISAPLHELSVTGKWDRLAEHITDEIFDRFAVVGRYDNLAEMVQERYGHFADRFYVGPLFSKSITPRNLKVLTDSVAAL